MKALSLNTPQFSQAVEKAIESRNAADKRILGELDALDTKLDLKRLAKTLRDIDRTFEKYGPRAEIDKRVVDLFVWRARTPEQRLKFRKYFERWGHDYDDRTTEAVQRAIREIPGGGTNAKSQKIDVKVAENLVSLLNGGSGATDDELNWLDAVFRPDDDYLNASKKARTQVQNAVIAAQETELKAILASNSVSTEKSFRAVQLANSIQGLYAAGINSMPDSHASAAQDKVDALKQSMERYLLTQPGTVRSSEPFRKFFEYLPDAASASLSALPESSTGAPLDAVRLLAAAARIDANRRRSPAEKQFIDDLANQRLTPRARQVYGAMQARATGPQFAQSMMGNPELAAHDKLVVWKNTDRVDSQGLVKQVDRPPIQIQGDKLRHAWFDIVLPHGAGQRFPAAKPSVDGDTVTDVGFDASQALYAVDLAISEIGKAGFSPQALIQKRFTIYSAKEKAFGRDMNLNVAGAYNPLDDSINLGLGDGAMHSSASHSIVVHEFGHLVLNRLMPDLINPEFERQVSQAGAFHEGFGDGLAALVNRNPKLGTEWGYFFGRPDRRTVDNDTNLGIQTTESHSAGNAYSGWIWKMRERAQSYGLNVATSNRFALRAWLLAGAYLDTWKPTPSDVGLSLLRALEESARLEHLPDATIRHLLEDGRAFAIRREILDAQVSQAMSRLEENRQRAQTLNIRLETLNSHSFAAALTKKLGSPLRPVMALPLPDGKTKLVAESKMAGQKRLLVGFADAEGHLISLSDEMVKLQVRAPSNSPS